MIEAELLQQEADRQERVLQLLRRQRQLLLEGPCQELIPVNRELLEAMEQAAAATEHRLALTRRRSARALNSAARKQWYRLRRASLLVREEAALNQRLAAELLAQTEHKLELTGASVAYTAEGRKETGLTDASEGGWLLDQAA